MLEISADGNRMIQTEYTDKFVAFIDVLGFSGIINQTIDENIKNIKILSIVIPTFNNKLEINYREYFLVNSSSCAGLICLKHIPMPGIAILFPHETTKRISALIGDLSCNSFIINQTLAVFVQS